MFTVKPAVAVKLRVLDHDGTPTTARFQFVDRQGHVFPPQAKRLAPDLFFQKHIYRADGEDVLLPPGELTMSYGRGPEYRWLTRTVKIPAPGRRRSGSRRGNRREARALDQSGGARLLQRRPSHPRGRVRALHVADRRRRSGRHVPAGQRRGAQCRQRADVGPRLRSSAAVFCAGARQAQRAADADEIRHRGQRLRVGGARPRRPARPEGSDLSRRGWQQGLADVDAAGAALDEGAGRCRRLRAFRQRPADRSRRRDGAAARAARHEQGRPAGRRRGCAGPPAGTVCRDRRRWRRVARGSGAESESQPRRRPVAELTRSPSSTASGRRRFSSPRHTAPPISSARWTPIASANGTRGIT